MKTRDMTYLQKDLHEFGFIQRPDPVSVPRCTYRWIPENKAAMVVDDKGFVWVGKFDPSVIKPPRELRQLG